MLKFGTEPGFNNRKNWAENNLIKKEEGELSFYDRIEKSMKKTDVIIENSRMVGIADSLLEEHGLTTILGFVEKDFEEKCDPYDPAVIVALCKTIEKNKKEEN